MTNHVHHDIIVAWARGATIQQYNDGSWKDQQHPLFCPDNCYRVKPVPIMDVAYIVIGSNWSVSQAYDTYDIAIRNGIYDRPKSCVIKVTRIDGIAISSEIVTKD